MSWLEREGKGERLGLGGNRWKRVKSMTSRTGPRVPLRQPMCLPCLNSAPFALRKLSRRAMVAVKDLGQVPVIQGGEDSDLHPVKKYHSTCSDMKRDTHTMSLQP